MNRYNIQGHLLELGHTWEEAEELRSQYAEEQNDAARDMQLLQEQEQAEYDKQLDNWSKA